MLRPAGEDALGTGLARKHYNSQALPLDLRHSNTRLARLHMTSRFIWSAVFLLLLQSGTFAQQPAPTPKAPPVQMDGEAAGLMQGWALMAQKQYGLAESHAQTVMGK